MNSELKAALELIKRTCDEHFDWRPDFCNSCPLELRDGCFLKSHVPACWDVAALEKFREVGKV